MPGLNLQPPVLGVLVSTGCLSSAGMSEQPDVELITSTHFNWGHSPVLVPKAVCCPLKTI